MALKTQTINQEALAVASSKIKDFKTSILEAFDSILSSGEITDETQLGNLARLRARVEIELKDF